MQVIAVEPLLMGTSPQYHVFPPYADLYLLLKLKPTQDRKATSVLISAYSVSGRPSKKGYFYFYASNLFSVSRSVNRLKSITVMGRRKSSSLIRPLNTYTLMERKSVYLVTVPFRK